MSDWNMQLNKFIILVALATALPVFTFAGISNPETDASDASEAWVPAVEIFVSPAGDDSWTGRIDRPLGSIKGARDMIRTIRDENGGLPEGGIRINIRGGIYTVTEGIGFAEKDSGTADAPIVYRAYAGEEAIFRGAIRLSADAFEPVIDDAILNRMPEGARDKVKMYDLSGLSVDVGAVPFRGHSYVFKPWIERGTEPPELIFNGEPMTVARWPNEGLSRFARIIEQGSRPRSGDKPTDENYRLPVLGFDDERPIRWATAADAWLHGYWGNEWSDQTIQIQSISPEARTIELAQASTYGIMERHRFFVFNLLEELDAPGEWYLDRENRVLYFYPPAEMADAEILLSQLAEPLLDLVDASYITFEGLTLEASRDYAVSIYGGSHNLLYNCTLRNLAYSAILIRGSHSHGVKSCHIHSIGSSGIIMGGPAALELLPIEHYADNNLLNNNTPEAKQLLPSNHFARNNLIHNFSRLSRTYTPAIAVSGIGQHVAHNEIHDSPHMGLFYVGNNHVFEFNKIYDVAKETGDVGGIYAGRDWISRGNIIRYNLFHSIKGLDGGVDAAPIYFDDAMSSALVEGNIIQGARARAVKIGGGHNLRVINNIFVECHTSVGLDDRLLGWGARMIPGLMLGLQSVVDRPAWLEAYPELRGILSREPGPTVPQNNVIKNNLILNSGNLRVADSALPFTTLENNLSTDRDPGFADPGNFDFSLPLDSWLFTEIPGFAPIPFDKIGRYDSH
jgi:hypothetical protein